MGSLIGLKNMLIFSAVLLAIGSVSAQQAFAGDPIGFSCEFTSGTGTATVTLIPTEESEDINKSVECVLEDNGTDPVDVEGVLLSGINSCTNSVPISTITPSFSGLSTGATATWIETITLNSDPGVASFDCEIRFLVDVVDKQNDTFLFQTVTINFVPLDINPQVVCDGGEGISVHFNKILFSSTAKLTGDGPTVKPDRPYEVIVESFSIFTVIDPIQQVLNVLDANGYLKNNGNPIKAGAVTIIDVELSTICGSGVNEL